MMRTGRKRRFLAIIAIAVPCAIAGCNALSRSGVCFKRLGWVSDNEKLLFAIAGNAFPHQASEEARHAVGNAYLEQQPGCCRLYRKDELFGSDEEVVEWGLVARPSYVVVKRNESFSMPNGERISIYGGNMAVSSCADAWWEWGALPMPIEWTPGGSSNMK